MSVKDEREAVEQQRSSAALNADSAAAPGAVAAIAEYCIDSLPHGSLWPDLSGLQYKANHGRPRSQRPSMSNGGVRRDQSFQNAALMP
jgi:hypothetical protein